MLERRGQHDCLDTIDRIKEMCSADYLEAKAEIDKAHEKAEARIEQANEYAYRQANKLEDVRVFAKNMGYDRVLRIIK